MSMYDSFCLENWKFPVITNSCTISIRSNRISIGYVTLYIACISPWFFIRYPVIIWLYVTYRKSISCDKRLVGTSHHHILLSLDILIVYGCDCNFLEDAVNVFDQVIVMDIVLVLLVWNGNISKHGVDGVSRWLCWFSWWYKRDSRVQGVLLIAHSDVRAAMLLSSKIGLKYAHISNVLLLDTH